MARMFVQSTEVTSNVGGTGKLIFNPRGGGSLDPGGGGANDPEIGGK